MLHPLSQATLNIIRDAGFPPNAENLLQRYIDLILTWGGSVSLVSKGDLSPSRLDEMHVRDALLVAIHLPQSSTIVDVGSGGGFPGIPIAIARPGCKVLLVERREKACSFLREVRRELSLNNFAILNKRIEDASSEELAGEVSTDSRLFVSRAFSPADELLTGVRKVARPNEQLLYIGGDNSTLLLDEQRIREAGWSLDRRIPYHPENPAKFIAELVAIQNLP